MSPDRFDALIRWAAAHIGLAPEKMDVPTVSGDASCRRYFRLRLPDGNSRIVMDAPPEQEDSRPFVDMARRLAAAGLPVPVVHAASLADGFLLLDDLGDTPLQTRLTHENAVLAEYDAALELLAELQNRVAPDSLPAYDTTLLNRELALFPEWCLRAWLGIEAPDGWDSLCRTLLDQALAQPTVTVHRDFDAMNLMCHRDTLYMIDFQDAVAGPPSYDLISLLRGRYWRLTPEQFARLAGQFYRQARADGRLHGHISESAFLYQANAVAAQRSLKVLGIFCRLTLRDGKSGYLARLPHFLDHLADSLAALPEHRNIAGWVDTTLRPAVMKQLAASEAPT